jgi:acetylglutamate kinase
MTLSAELEMPSEIQNRSTESIQEISLEKWGTQLMENILLAAAEAVAERNERADSVDVTLTFRLTPIISSDQLQVSVAFKKDPTLVTHIPR